MAVFVLGIVDPTIRFFRKFNERMYRIISDMSSPKLLDGIRLHFDLWVYAKVV